VAALLAEDVTIDIHSHAGQLIRRDAAFGPVAAPMRAGGMTTICLAIVADAGTTRVLADGRIAAYRSPDPGELYRRSQESFRRAHRLIADQGLALVVDDGTLAARRGGGPGAIVTAEGADFLDRDLGRLDEAHKVHHLRHLQLTHYRVNELGDIQTEPPVHGGLTDFGADVVRGCNRLGIVVDVAHGTFDLVKRAAEVTTTPLVLSHTSLSANPRPRSRTISADHARLVAATGGVIGVWPPTTIFRDRDAYARGIASMVEIVGIDHVGIGSDMLGLTSPSAFGDYRELPDLAASLLAAGFDKEGAAKVLGGNYRRVFAMVMAARRGEA
jgi:membrane dipeptidase